MAPTTTMRGGALRAAAAVATVLAAVATVLAAGAEVYPFPSYLRPLLALDPYMASYCVLTGAPGSALGTGTQMYEGVQPCTVAQVALQSGGIGSAPLVWIMPVGSNGAQAIDLGTSANLTAAWGQTATFYSLRFNDAAQQFQTGTAATPISLPDNVVAPLRTTTASYAFPVVAGHIYLIRITSVAGTTSDWSGTDAIVKAIVVDWPASATDAVVPTLRWEVIAGATGPAPAQQASRLAASAHRLGAWGVALSVICLVVILGVAGYTFYQRRRAGGGASAVASVGSSQAGYQALDK